MFVPAGSKSNVDASSFVTPVKKFQRRGNYMGRNFDPNFQNARREQGSCQNSVMPVYVQYPVVYQNDRYQQQQQIVYYYYI